MKSKPSEHTIGATCFTATFNVIFLDHTQVSQASVFNQGVQTDASLRCNDEKQVRIFVDPWEAHNYHGKSTTTVMNVNFSGLITFNPFFGGI